MRAEPVASVDDELRRTGERMISLMQDADGVGLAATQVGILRRFFVFRDEEDALLVVNPEITSSSREKETDEEGCPVARAATRRACSPPQWKLDGEGALLKLELEGLAASHSTSSTISRGRLSSSGRIPSRARGHSSSPAPRARLSRIAVAATASFGADVLERLAERHDVTTLLTRPVAPAGRGRKLAAPPAKETAVRLGIPVVQPARPAAGLDAGGASTVVVCAYGLLIPEDILAEQLWLSVHPSLLPRWRGAAPVERAIMAGDAETGVTIHRTVKQLDAGPIAAQQAFEIAPDEDAGAVYARAAETAAALLDEVLAAPRRASCRRPTTASPMRNASARPTASSTAVSPPASSSIAFARCRRTSAREPCCTTDR